LSLLVGSIIPGTHIVDQTKLADFKLGIDIGRSLLSVRLGSAATGATPDRPAQRSHSPATE
jgi:hypothetical protein